MFNIATLLLHFWRSPFQQTSMNVLESVSLVLLLVIACGL
jgi:hypothetical protein